MTCKTRLTARGFTAACVSSLCSGAAVPDCDVSVGYANFESPLNIFEGQMSWMFIPPLLSTFIATRLGLKHSDLCIGPLLRSLLFLQILPLKSAVFASLAMSLPLISLPALQDAPARDRKGRNFSAGEVRCFMSVVTCTAIYGVDMSLWPLRNAKSMEWGISMMDIGTGLVLFCSGLVKGNSSRWTGWTGLLKRNAVVAIIGFIRVVAMAGKHVAMEEYGKHWNFYFTIAAVDFLGSILVPLTTARSRNPITPLILCAAILMMVAQGLTWVIDLEWVFHGDRDSSFLAANREGVLSCIGYLSLRIAGHAAAFWIAGKSTRPRWQHLVGALLTWLILGGFPFVAGWIPSRRLANAPYCLGVIATGAWLYALFVMAETIVAPVGDVAGTVQKSTPYTAAISRKPLMHFLLCNIIMGLLNSSTRSLTFEPALQVAILSG